MIIPSIRTNMIYNARTSTEMDPSL